MYIYNVPYSIMGPNTHAASLPCGLWTPGSLNRLDDIFLRVVLIRFDSWWVRPRHLVG